MRFINFCIIFLICVQAYGQEWLEREPLPISAPARNHPVTFAIGEYGYVVTGLTDNGPVKDFYRYNTLTNQWDKLPDFPGTRRGFSYGIAYEGKGYIGFGFSGVVLNDLWSYDPVKEEWKELTPCPCKGRRHPAFVETNGKIYVGLGDDLTSNLKDFWAYDIASDTWEQLPEFPSLNRHHPFYFSIGKDVFVGMGHGSVEVEDWDVYRDFYKFDTEDYTWTRLNDFPGEARVAGTQFDYNGKGYILHGEGEDHQILDDGEFWEYDPADDSWKQLISVPNGSLWAPGSFVVGNTVYSVAGSTYTYVNIKDMWAYEFAPASSTTNLKKNSGFTISPNPVNDCITIHQPVSERETNESFQYEIRTLEGKLVYSGKSQSNMICPGFLREGAYLLFMINDNAPRTVRFVKM
ncbi:MAG: hypothetical protein IPN79_18630 [Saprospiraceae bacterium]|nr:hypothetical protein [Saprospiraceae bacterium]